MNENITAAEHLTEIKKGLDRIAKLAAEPSGYIKLALVPNHDNLGDFTTSQAIVPIYLRHQDIKNIQPRKVGSMPVAIIALTNGVQLTVAGTSDLKGKEGKE